MRALNEAIDDLRRFVRSREHRSWKMEERRPWPPGGTRNLVLGEDVACELGSPQQASVSSLLWTDDANRIQDECMTLIGPDIGEARERSLPFGKIVLVEVDGWGEEEIYHRYLEMEAVRHDLDLKGYMIRAVSSAQKEWCRISREALENGFSIQVLGAALIEKLKGKPYVRKAELLYVTSCAEDVKSIQSIVQPTLRVIRAMNKMVRENVLDCETCEYSDVCNEIRMLSNRARRAS